MLYIQCECHFVESTKSSIEPLEEPYNNWLESPNLTSLWITKMTSPDTIESLRQSPGWLAAIEEARQGFSEGGLPVGACVVSKTNKILGRGRNMLVQNGTPQMHVCLSTPNDSFISDIIQELL
jgi:hypothetical protein